jgi:hypothetical protein
MKQGIPLFSQFILSSVLRGCEEAIPSEVERLSADQIRTLPEEQIVEHLSTKLRVEPLVLLEDRKRMEYSETKIDMSGDLGRDFRPGRRLEIPGTEVRITIPFYGNPDLWRVYAGGMVGETIRGEVLAATPESPGLLIITLAQRFDMSQQLMKDEFDAILSTIRSLIESQKGPIDQFNGRIAEKVRQVVSARRQRLDAQFGLQKLFNIPLKPRDGSLGFEPLKLERQLVRPLPEVPKGGYPAEPGITDSDYDHILGVIRHVGRTFETAPRTFQCHDEEGLRDIVLANLNGHYQGDATGETFRKEGKTDIRIEAENRAAFIAECKVWTGPVEFSAAIDQLLGYLTWRDCKTALIIFNKHNARFSDLLDKIPATFASNPAFKRAGARLGAGEWRFTLIAPGDEAREIVVTVFAFDLFVK